MESAPILMKVGSTTAAGSSPDGSGLEKNSHVAAPPPPSRTTVATMTISRLIIPHPFAEGPVSTASSISKHRPRKRPIPPLSHAGSRRSEEHTSELQSQMRISYAVFCLKTKKKKKLIAP